MTHLSTAEFIYFFFWCKTVKGLYRDNIYIEIFWKNLDISDRDRSRFKFGDRDNTNIYIYIYIYIYEKTVKKYIFFIL